MIPYEKHVLVCTNRRDPNNPKGSCANSGSEAICEAFKKELHGRGLKGRMRANASGCLDQCAHGPTVVVYPDAVWYQVKTADEAREIVEQHLCGGQPVERLRIDQKDGGKAGGKEEDGGKAGDKPSV